MTVDQDGGRTLAAHYPTMLDVTASAVTAAPPAKLWELICDTSRSPNGWRERLR